MRGGASSEWTIFVWPGGAIFVPEGFRSEFSLQAALTLSRLKPVLHARFGGQPSGCADLEQPKACTPCLVRSSAQSSGLEFSLQAALTLSRLKPVLHAWFGGQPRVQVWSSDFRLC